MTQGSGLCKILLIASETRRRRDIKIGPHAEKHNVVSNDHGHTQKWDFSVLDQKYPFWAILVQKIKISSLS